MTPTRSHPAVVLTRYWDGPNLARHVIPVRSVKHSETLRRIQRVAASLQRSEPVSRQAGPAKQETPGTAIPEVSTLTHSAQTERRAAGVQSGTGSTP